MRRAYNHIDGILDLVWMQNKLSKAEVLYHMADLMYNQERPYRTHDIGNYDDACRAYRMAKTLKEECFSNVQTIE